MKIKYKILPFIVGIMLAGCGARHDSSEQSVALNDSIPKSTKEVSLIDSVTDGGLRKLLAADSIDLLDVKHVQSGQYLIEQILYLDRKISTNFKYLSDTNMIDFNSSFEMSNDTVTHLKNPYAEMNGLYLNVYKYKGKFIFYKESDGGIIPRYITDSCIWRWGQVNWSGIRYKSAVIANEGIITYGFGDNGKYMIQIKKLGGETDLQLWRTLGESTNNDTFYEFMVPIRKSTSIQNLFARNNLGAGADMNVTLDPINYDSLMNSR